MTNSQRAMRHLFAGLAAAALIGAAATASAEPGITSNTIRIGMSNALTGPAAGLGTELKAGSEAYISRINAAGGIHGRKIVLVSKDDGYEPARAAAATKALIGQDNIFALFDYVGTPTSAAAVPLASKARVPYLFPFTGAEFLRYPINRLVFNIRASYFDETEAMVDHLVKDAGAKKIAIFIQNDAFGEAGKAGVARALFKRGMKIAAEARFKRNTLAVEAGLAKIKAANPDGVIFIGTYAPFAKIVKLAKSEGITAKFMTVSFIGTSDFIRKAGAAGNGVYITQVVPSPDSSTPLVAQFMHDIKGGPVSYTSLEGYVNAEVLVQALKKAGAEPTRASLLGALNGLNMDLGGLHVGFSPKNHQGSNKVFLTVVRDGKAVPINRL